MQTYCNCEIIMETKSKWHWTLTTLETQEADRQRDSKHPHTHTHTHCRWTRARSRQLQAAEIGVRSRHGLAENCPPSATTKSSRVRDMYLSMYVYNMIIYGQKTMDNVVSVHGQNKCQLLALWQSERAKSWTVFLASSSWSLSTKVDSADVFCQAGFLVPDLGRASTAQCITEWLSVGWTCLLADFRVPQNQIHIYIRVGHRKWSRAVPSSLKTSLSIFKFISGSCCGFLFAIAVAVAVVSALGTA